uniref:ATP synthase complex subunit 8 n=1 Tax=Odorrana grahami TaxID=167935 RepID=A0A8A4YS11_ODOGR|nr:ATP synthase F0 subunit 8 [Odorrana grahami]YP_010442976.1 ATP synthase F0 subunit 8 [Odorrana jingdongensis]QTE20714.1 ATP synthase F0 subunit 8 [Odorrana grahami]UTD48926.1 ATP synthase F0 subunit 8 [Odorrana jingdongensis]
MPQLDPVPWFCYLTLTWLIFMLLTPQKILTHINLNAPSIKKAKTLPSQVWPWTWQ